MNMSNFPARETIPGDDLNMAGVRATLSESQRA
jgi:hypothetical protein